MAAEREPRGPLRDEGPESHRTCVRIIHGNFANEETAKEIALVVDGSGYAAALKVLPTFGCVLHEPKPT